MSLEVTTEAAAGDKYETPFVNPPENPYQLEIDLAILAQLVVAIAAVDTTNDTVTISETPVTSRSLFSELNVGDTFDITGSTGNDGTYTIRAIEHDQANSQIILTTEESISDATADGSVVLSVPRSDFVDEDGVLKPGIPLRYDGTRLQKIDADAQTAFGLIAFPENVAESNDPSDLSGDRVVTLHTDGIFNRAVAEDNLERTYTADEVTAIDNSQDLRMV